MGLDQYAEWTEAEHDPESEETTYIEFKYWRKASHIQDFFQKIYAEKTGITDPYEFNCVKVEIDYDVLNRFITAVKTNAMTPVGGFLFGAKYDANASDVVESDLRFAADCFFHLLMGRRVWYKSSW